MAMRSLFGIVKTVLCMVINKTEQDKLFLSMLTVRVYDCQCKKTFSTILKHTLTFY